MEQVILDVREQDEFAAEHVPGSIWVPLSQFGHCAPGVLQSLAGRQILIMCRSGNRAKLALEQIEQLGFGGQLSVMPRNRTNSAGCGGDADKGCC